MDYEVYHTRLSIPDYRCIALAIKTPTPNHPDNPHYAKLGEQNIRTSFDTGIQVHDQFGTLFVYQNELVRRLLADTCELCGSKDRIAVHHVRKLADIKKKFLGRKSPPDWAKFMLARNRKTVVVCHKCHVEIHAGRYDGIKVKSRLTGEPGATETGAPGSERGVWKSASPVRRARVLAGRLLCVSPERRTRERAQEFGLPVLAAQVDHQQENSLVQVDHPAAPIDAPVAGIDLEDQLDFLEAVVDALHQGGGVLSNV